MEQLRLIAAAFALAIPAVVFALNATISFRERGLAEPLDIAAAIVFFVLAVLAWRGSRPALVGGAALVAAYLVSTLIGGPVQFVAYWTAALLVILLAALVRPATRTI